MVGTTVGGSACRGVGGREVGDAGGDAALRPLVRITLFPLLMNDSGPRPATHPRQPSRDWMTHAFGRVIVPLGVSAEHPAPTRRWRVWAFAAATIAIMFGISLAPRLAPVPQADVGAVGAWDISVSSASDRPVTAIMYGETIGLHIVRLPSASSSPYTLIRANLGERGVTLISIGRSSLALQGSTNATDPAYARAASATSRFITIDRKGISTGIRR